MNVKKIDLEKYLKDHPAIEYTAEQLDDMRNYINASLILDDLKRDYSEYQKGKTGNPMQLDVIACLSSIRRSLITFGNLLSIGPTFNQYKSCEMLSSKSKNNKNLVFLSELRDKIGAHLQKDVIANTRALDPFIITRCTFESIELSILHIYISLFESGVNYVNSEPKYSLFEGKIDIYNDFYKDNGFIAMVEKMYEDTISYLEIVLPIIKKKLDPKDGISLSDLL